MVMETNTYGDERTEDAVRGGLRARAGGDAAALDVQRALVAPADLVLTPAPECRKLSRGISRATDNEGLVWALRAGAGAADDEQDSPLTADHVFLLPDISVYPVEFRNFIEKDLLETATLATLESAGVLNWWGAGRVPGAPRLLPLATSGDGNCLPHAASLAAYGFHDRLLALRARVQALLRGDAGPEVTAALKRRWRYSEAAALRACGLSPSDAEWEREWAEAAAAASPAPRAPASAPPRWAALEPLHVLALVHAMRRPALVFADVALRDHQGDPLAPIPFGGVYLPLQLPPARCGRAPLLLAYDGGHFSALAPREPLAGVRVPLQDAAGQPLPLRFLVDPGEDYRWDAEPDQQTINSLLPDEDQRNQLLAAYLDLEYVECPGQTPEDLRRSLDALATKPKQSVAKQFGSIGRSMSSKLRSFGSMARLGRGPPSPGSPHSPESPGAASPARAAVACCRVRAARAPVQDEMVKNYLNEAWLGFTAEKSRAADGAPHAPRYGTGRSRFYAEADAAAHAAAARPARPARAPDRTLYLSRSTFYDDRPPSPQPCRAPLCMYYGSRENDDYCSRCAKLQ